MKVYKTQQEIEKDIKDGELYVDGDVKFECSFVIDANIRVDGNIDAINIDAYNINAINIDAININAINIDAININANNINANNIDANNINADNIDAVNINANNINANNISYYAVCFAYASFKCKSVKGSRENCKHFCLDGEIELKDKEPDLSGTEVEVKVNGKTYKARIE